MAEDFTKDFQKLWKEAEQKATSPEFLAEREQISPFLKALLKDIKKPAVEKVTPEQADRLLLFAIKYPNVWEGAIIKLFAPSLLPMLIKAEKNADGFYQYPPGTMGKYSALFENSEEHTIVPLGIEYLLKLPDFEKELTEIGNSLSLSYIALERAKKAIKVQTDKDPFYKAVKEELEAIKKDPKWGGVDFSSLIFEQDPNTTPRENLSLHDQALLEAIERAEKKLDPKAIVSISRKLSPLTEIPIDKVNNRVWRLLENEAIDGQYRINFLTGEETKRGVQPLVTFCLDFSQLEKELPIVRKLTAYDKRVMMSSAALYKYGNEYQTLTMIYHKMGNPENKRPSKSDLDKINNSLTKQRATILKLNNDKEKEAGFKYPQIKFDGPLIMFERVTAEIDGKVLDGVIHVAKEPVLIRFARERKQTFSIPNKILESPLSKTEKNLPIEDYFLERIAVMKKNPEFSRTILFSTVLKECNMEKDRHPGRIKKTIDLLLDHYKATKFIKDFSMDDKEIVIFLEVQNEGEGEAKSSKTSRK